MRALQGPFISAIVRAIHGCGLSTVSLRPIFAEGGRQFS